MAIRFCGSIAFLVAAAGCSRSSNVVEAPMISVDASAALLANESPASSGDRRPMPRSGDRFIGTYLCGQGPTHVTIEIDDVGRGDDELTVEARFEFSFEGDDDADDARGAYRMRGKYEMRTRRLVLKPEAWIEEPPGYVMVGIRGTIGRSGDTYSGTVEGPSCTTFDTKLDPRAAGH